MVVTVASFSARWLKDWLTKSACGVTRVSGAGDVGDGEAADAGTAAAAAVMDTGVGVAAGVANESVGGVAPGKTCVSTVMGKRTL